jgi:hypothetical protein
MFTIPENIAVHLCSSNSKLSVKNILKNMDLGIVKKIRSFHSVHAPWIELVKSTK